MSGEIIFAPMSEREEANINAVRANMEKWLRLLNSGAGGAAQLRKIFRTSIETIDMQLALRPRPRDLEKR